MYLAPILAIIIIRFLRKSLETAEVLPGWDKILMAGNFVSIALIVLQATIPGSRMIVMVAEYAMLFYLSYLVFFNPGFRAGKQVIYAALPLMIISLLNDVIKIINPTFLAQWNNYVDTADLFAIVWMAAMLYINKRQQKALQTERLKTKEKEKENRITEELKAALEIQVAERTAALTTQTESLQQALTELRSTQAQLIQSEKMASLGELTAGIAHEIQNPLNFVNNFSEVNKELLVEMKAEIDKGNMEEVKSLANDIIDNEEKINHHGKRADGIVKGMLQHSRSSNGQKELTDINVLADEYLRLAYHGLRAKDKSFNAAIKTEFDQSIGKINIVPQDIGRVILNLLTNAFYAVSEKKKLIANSSQPTASNYEATVSLNTKKINNKIEISIADNGNGIPQKIMEKIFQPFFTTKPTGEGTGLGLSMSYDIITNGHQGELKVRTKTGEGAVFTIILHI